MKILISAPYMLKITERPYVEKLLSNYDLDVTWADVCERLSETDLLEIIYQYDGIICGDDRFTKQVYEKAINLKVIVKWGTGIDSLLKEEAEQRGIQLFRTADAFTNPVADTTLAYILAFARTLRENDDLMKNGEWGKPQGYSLFERTVGIIGFGNIGQAVYKRLKAFDCKVIVNEVDDQIKNMYSSEIDFVSKEEIYKNSHFITLHTDLNSTTHKLLSKESFMMMENKPYIINTSRGGAIDENAMIAALNEGLISGVGLDVFEEEPLDIKSPLRKMKNAFLASHNSNSSPASWKRVHENSINMLVKGLGLE